MRFTCCAHDYTTKITGGQTYIVRGRTALSAHDEGKGGTSCSHLACEPAIGMRPGSRSCHGTVNTHRRAAKHARLKNVFTYYA